jgi:transposase
MNTYYIGADVHCNKTELAVERKNKIIRRFSVPTTIPAISEILKSIPGRKHLTFEEGPMAGWLYRNLNNQVDTITVCDPRRNKLIASDGDKDDKIDAAKLACLLRGKYLRRVYHGTDDKIVELKRWVGLYHDRVKQATACINKIRSQARMYGIKIPRRVLREVKYRQDWLCSLSKESVAKRLQVLWIGYDASAQQTKLSRQQMSKLAGRYPIIRYWDRLPGVGPIRATTIFAYLETPWRFKRKNKVWKYCGVGLVRQFSGGRAGRLKMNWSSNKRLKNAAMGAAMSAIHHRDNVFKDDYERMVKDGITPSNARHAVARKLLTVMWGMWKNMSRFDKSLC